MDRSVDPLDYIKNFWRRGDFFNRNSEEHEENSSKSRFRFGHLFCVFKSSIRGVIDFSGLILFLFFVRFISNRRVSFLFITRNFCYKSGSEYTLTVRGNLINSDTVLINTSKNYYIKKLDGVKVYNLGLLVKPLSLLIYPKRDNLARNFFVYTLINDTLLTFNSVIKDIYFLFYYDLNSFSLIFSKYRNYINLIEVQHGSMINFFPYAEPSPVKIADVFYVRNTYTIEYLKQNLCKEFNCEYKLMEYCDLERKVVPGLNILYASTIEFQGFHPVFKIFLQEYSTVFPYEKLNLTIRLHPRERGKENLFISDLHNSDLDFKFDNSENWLLSNAIEGLIVISPWSSIIEEACDNHFRVITIDEIGKNRFSFLSDNFYFDYSNDLISFFKKLE